MFCFKDIFHLIGKKCSFGGQTSSLANSLTNGLHINYLSNEVLLLIFELLDFESLLRSQLVCRRWKRLIEWRIGIVRHLSVTNLHDCRSFGGTNLSVMALKDIKKKLMRREKSCNIILRAIVSKHFAITSLCLFFSDFKMHKNVLRLVTDSCDTDLRHFVLKIDDKRIKFSTKEVELFCHKFPNLKTVRLEINQLVVQQQSIETMVSIWQSLETFVVRELYFKDERRLMYNGVCFRALSPTVKVIKTSGQIFDTMAFMYLQLNRIKNIEYVSISSVDDIRNVQILCQTCPNITRLALSFANPYSQDNALDMWSAISLLHSLRNLDLVLQPISSIVCDNCVKNLRNCPQLTSLSIKASHMSDDAVKTLVQCCPQLTRLTLLYINFVIRADEAVAPLAQLKKLIKLHIMTYPPLSDQTIVDLMKNSPELRHINLSRVKTLTVQTLLSMIGLANSCPQQYFQINVWRKLRPKLKDIEQQIPNNLIVHFV